LAPLPLCDPNHKYCLCIKDTECNSSGLSNGGCYAGDCDAGCTSLLNIDSTGCGAVLPTCNLNPSLCPANTVCEFGGNWNTRMDLCGNSYQCCWCTSDNGCPVSHKCINDLNDAGVGANNCAGTGKGPCTGKGTNWDGMHCQLTDPGGSGIPMCAAISSCAKGNCKDVTSPTATCGAAGTTCWCTNDNQCAPGKCVAWAGCGAGACNGTGMADGFNCAPY
jgi:hypothetical protein